MTPYDQTALAVINPPPSLTQLLNQAAHGDQLARNEAFERIYAELHDQARRLMLEERNGHTLTPTALVHELFMRVFVSESPGWEGHEQFLRYARTAMAHLLIDHARYRNRLRRGGGNVVNDPTDVPEPGMEDDSEFLAALDQALETLAKIQPRAARVLELRCLAGLSTGETAAMLGASERTVVRDWELARGLLSQMLDASEPSAHD